jgi:hypothetical protein
MIAPKSQSQGRGAQRFADPAAELAQAGDQPKPAKALGLVALRFALAVGRGAEISSTHENTIRGR